MNELDKVELRVGNYNGHIDEITDKLTWTFEYIHDGINSLRRVTMFRFNEDRYMLMLSMKKMDFGDYNTMVSIHGPNEKVLEILLDDFEKRTGIQMQDPPKDLEKLMKEQFAKISVMFRGPPKEYYG